MNSEKLNSKGVQKLVKRSFWKPKNFPVWTFVCPLCRTTRRVPYRPRPGDLHHTLQILLTALAFTVCGWPWFNIKGVLSFFPFWIIFELVYRKKRRLALVCQDCGFDPFIYRIDLQWAKKEIEAHWRKKFADKGIPYPGDEKAKPKVAPSNPSPSEKPKPAEPQSSSSSNA